MTALQWIVKEAKSIKKAYPNRFAKWTDYVKQASAIYATKHKGKSPVGKKKAVKKTPKKKVGVIKKKIVKKAAPKKIIKKHTHYGKIKSHMRRVNGVTKKPSEKDVLKSITHAVKVQKSHMSVGNLDNKLISEYKDTLGRIRYYETTIDMFKIAIKQHKERGLTPSNVLALKKDIKKFNSIIKELRTHSRELRKHI